VVLEQIDAAHVAREHINALVPRDLLYLQDACRGLGGAGDEPRAQAVPAELGRVQPRLRGACLDDQRHVQPTSPPGTHLTASVHRPQKNSPSLTPAACSHVWTASTGLIRRTVERHHLDDAAGRTGPAGLAEGAVEDGNGSPHGLSGNQHGLQRPSIWR
jgi:hypothetical protein